MPDNKKKIFIEIKSSDSLLTLGELVEEAYSRQISVFHTRIGHHFPIWMPIHAEDEAIYAIDNISVCGGEITHLKKRAFRPRWFPDYEEYKTYVAFIQGMCCHIFGDDWIKYMIQQHIEAIDKKKWLFTVFAIIKPTYHLSSNKSILDQRVKAMIEEDDEMSRLEAVYEMNGID